MFGHVCTLHASFTERDTRVFMICDFWSNIWMALKTVALNKCLVIWRHISHALFPLLPFSLLVWFVLNCNCYLVYLSLIVLLYPCFAIMRVSTASPGDSFTKNYSSSVKIPPLKYCFTKQLPRGKWQSDDRLCLLIYEKLIDVFFCTSFRCQFCVIFWNSLLWCKLYIHTTTPVRHHFWDVFSMYIVFYTSIQ